MEGIEAAARVASWAGLWANAEFESVLRPDALSWSSDDVKDYVSSHGAALPEERRNDPDSERRNRPLQERS
eukprot:156038-Amphidinium_carterae.1